LRRESEWSKKDREKHADALERYQAFCRELGKEPADVALAWLLTRPIVTAPIIGPRTLEQLDTALGALEVRLDAATLSRLDEIFPGYKTSPEVFAW
jgi:aryl-alcohol dehydrogenase-like predicted oxidoreductase